MPDQHVRPHQQTKGLYQGHGEVAETKGHTADTGSDLGNCSSTSLLLQLTSLLLLQLNLMPMFNTGTLVGHEDQAKSQVGLSWSVHSPSYILGA